MGIAYNYENRSICSKEALIYRRLHHLLLPSSKDSWGGPKNGSVPNNTDTDWLDVGNLLRTEFPYARAMMAASFASPLIPLLDHRNIYYHVCAPSLTAKTAILRFAMSIWFDPKQNILFYNATDAGFRDHAEMISPLPLAIDQLEYLQKSSKFPSLIYELSEHYFRDDEKPRPLYRKKCEWHNCIISTGKDSIRSIAPNLKHYPSLLDVKAQPMDSKAAKEFGDYIWSLAGSNYGFAGRLYIKFLEKKEGEEGKGSEESLRPDYLRMLDYLKLLPVSNAVRYEWIENVAVIALADYYASQAVFGVEDRDLAWSEAVKLGKQIMTAM